MIQEYLEDKQSKLVLYVYDSFLFDVSKADGPEVLEHIQEILEMEGYTTSVKVGKDYAHLKQLTD
jgi:DNA polymerase I-like protein with 3'-5' exonuclease and polymerase domains